MLNTDEQQAKTRRVVVADDHAIVRKGTVDILVGIDNAILCTEVEDGLAAIAATKELLPDLLVLDAAMPMATGIEVLAECRRWSKGTAVVLLTGFTSSGILSKWMNAEVDGVLLKTCTPEEMTTCFKVVLAGGKFVCQAAQEILESAPSMEALSGRENQVLALIVRGHSNTEIAESLHISVRTVEKHRASLMNKLGVRTVAELLIYAMKEGLLDEQQQL